MMMSRLAQITAVTATLFGGLALTWSHRAEACSCLPPHVTSSYSNSSDVFTGKVVAFLGQAGGFNFYSVRVIKTYKGCLTARSLTTIKSAVSSATCGQTLTVGKSYLLNASATSTRNVKSISLCGYNVETNALTAKDLEFLNGRTVCCKDSCTCADGTTPVNCLVDPCEVAPECPEGTCTANYCGGCNAEFFDSSGLLVCQETFCESDKDCSEAQYCATDGVCRDDATCGNNVDCNLAGNNYIHPLCVGFGVCEKEQCGWQCGDSRCVDYSGYDFGPCEALLGWGVVDGLCTNITGCEAPFKLFADEKECVTSCGY